MTASHLLYKYMTGSQLIQPTRRARQAGQKLERRQAILNTAWRMFQESTYEAVTMDSVARGMGLAKGTLFLYFRTKEELFLALTAQQLSGWFAAMDEKLAQISGTTDSLQVVTLLADSLRERVGFTRLLAILSTVLEQNITYESALEFKRQLAGLIQHTGAELERCLPFLKTGDGAHLILQCQAIVVGLWHLSDPSPVVKQVISLPEMRAFQVDFDREFRQILAALLKNPARP
jgi:AcrR family transcriptional regulator